MRVLTAALLLLPLLSPSLQAQHHAGTQRSKVIEPTGSTLLIDTTEGRLTCRLFEKEAPQTTAYFSAQVQARRYDATVMTGVTDGVGGSVTPADPPKPFPVEKNALTVDRAGVLGMESRDGLVLGDRFIILEHGDEETRKRLAPIALCDTASIEKVQSISHQLLTVGNRPQLPVMINRMLLVKSGDPLPPLSANVNVQPLTYPPIPGSEVPAPEPTGPTAVIRTTEGTLTCRLFKETPNSTENFIGLAEGTKSWKHPRTGQTIRGKHYYEGLHFARVIPDFMVQQSDMPGDPGGDSSIGFHFSNEIVPGLLFDRPGRLAYANDGPTTNSSEFFVTETPQHRLDGKYTIFGQCDADSQKVVATIARVPRDAHNRPLKPVTILSVQIRREKK